MKINKAILVLLFLTFILSTASGITIQTFSIIPNPVYEGQEVIVTATVSTSENWKLRCGDSTGVYNLCASENFVSKNQPNTCSFTNPFANGDSNKLYCQAFLESDVNNLIDGGGFEFRDYNVYTYWEDMTEPDFGSCPDTTTSESTDEWRTEGRSAIKVAYGGCAPNNKAVICIASFTDINTNPNDWEFEYGVGEACGTQFSFPYSDNFTGTITRTANHDGNKISIFVIKTASTFVGGGQPYRVESLINYTTEDFNSMKLSVDWNFMGTLAGNPYFLDDVRIHEDQNSSEQSEDLNTIQPFTEFLTCNKIENVASCIVDFNVVRVTPSNESNRVVFSLVSDSGSAHEIPIRLINSLKDGKQYFIYTSEDVVNYAFDDTLTFGSNNTNPIQKIFNIPANKYYHTITDQLMGIETKYYRYTYQRPAYVWDSLQNNLDWDMELEPTYTDVNGYSRDIYAVSKFANMRSKMINELPNITSNTNPNFAFQFNAYFSDASSQVIKVGTITGQNVESTNDVTLTKSEHRYNENMLANFLFKKTTNTTSSTIYMNDYALIQRGFFITPLELKTAGNNALPVAVGDENNYYEYVNEGQKFRIDTTIGNWQNNLDYYEVKVYISEITDVNRVAYYRFDLDTNETIIRLNNLLNGILDLTANAPDRDIKVVVRVVDHDADYFEVQSKWIKMHQYPKYPKDIEFFFNQVRFKVGDSPEGRVNLIPKAPEVLRGIHFEIFDTNNDTNSADFNITLYKGIDFSCTGIFCSFDYKFSEYKFPKASRYTMRGTLLVTTESFNTDNPLLSKELRFFVYFKIFRTARIFQTRERIDLTYRNDEPIELVVQLRDSDGSNMQDDLDVYINLDECDAGSGGNCKGFMQTKYYPNSFHYDSRTGYNYYIYRQVFLEDDLTLLSDTNYFRFRATVSDERNLHQIAIFPVLTSKCFNDSYQDAEKFFGNLFIYGLAYAGINLVLQTLDAGCTIPQAEIVTTDTNSGQERRILIDDDHSLLNPEQKLFMCLNVDNNFSYRNNLEQELLCATWYRLSERPIDSFDLLITNEASDLSEREDEFKQFVEMRVPFETIAFNDLALMKISLDERYNTSIDTVGEMLWFGFGNIFSGVPTQFGSLAKFLTGEGIITNIGVDYNFDRPLDARFVSGFVFYKIKGLEIINRNDYKNVQGLDVVPLKYFLRQANELDVTLPDNETEIIVYTSDFKKALQKTVKSNLIIDEEPSKTTFRLENIDVNGQPKTQTSPNLLTFNIISQMNFDWERQFDRKFVVIWLNALLKEQSTILGIIETAFWENIGWVALILIIVLILSVIIANLRGRGSSVTVNPIIHTRGG